MSKRLLCFIFLVVVFSGCSNQGVTPAKSVLFIGNSFTSVNDLPATFTQLAKSGGMAVVTGMCAPGGYRLNRHISDPATLKALDSRKWDIVVLQEQSQVPAIENERDSNMYPAVRGFNERIRKAGSVPLLYMTWGRKDGCPEIGYSDYSSMQEKLIEGYNGIAAELSIEVAPVGIAWKTVVERRPYMAMWASDGVHPSPAGTYLAAAVFYAVIFHQSPAGLNFTGSLTSGDAGFLQGVAAETVLKDLKK
jgi:hypothetical protein